MSDLEYYFIAFICAIVLIVVYMDQTGMIDTLTPTAPIVTNNSTGGGTPSAPQSPFHVIGYVQTTGELL